VILLTACAVTAILWLVCADTYRNRSISGNNVPLVVALLALIPTVIIIVEVIASFLR
jgi:hypothetical protein